MRLIIGIFALLFLSIIGITLVKGVSFPQFALWQKQARLTINDEKFVLKVAQTEEEKQQGLTKQKTLAAHEGMLFTFATPAAYPFWSRTMQFPVDMLFVKDKKVVSLVKHVAVPKMDGSDLQVYMPPSAIDMMIELPAGTSDTLNIAPGMVLNLSL